MILLELELQILEMSERIHRYFPELSKYLTDLPLRLLDKTVYGENMVKLKEYSLFLEKVLDEYPKSDIFKNDKRQSMDDRCHKSAFSIETGTAAWLQLAASSREAGEMSQSETRKSFQHMGDGDGRTDYSGSTDFSE